MHVLAALQADKINSKVNQILKVHSSFQKLWTSFLITATLSPLAAPQKSWPSTMSAVLRSYYIISDLPYHHESPLLIVSNQAKCSSKERKTEGPWGGVECGTLQEKNGEMQLPTAYVLLSSSSYFRLSCMSLYGIWKDKIREVSGKFVWSKWRKMKMPDYRYRRWIVEMHCCLSKCPCRWEASYQHNAWRSEMQNTSAE